ncbi:hypothetical protein Tco_0804746 [Tanacetum coccineum]|uniref:Uncharacterized protein n=1 Tax=Tanacetum coccineum TaxID=301880 RepID=A0ABQ5A9H6_9ASTR
MSLTHLKGLPAGALKLGQDHTQTWDKMDVSTLLWRSISGLRKKKLVAALSCEPTVSSLNNDEIDFRISFDKSDDEDCTVIFNKKSFSYKIIYVNNLKTDSENDNEKVSMPLLPSPKPTVSCFDDLDFFNDLENEFPAIVYNDAQTSKLDDLDYFKDFEKEFPAIVYNDAQTSKLDFSTKPVLNPQHIDKFNLKDETSLSECDEEEQNILNFNDLFPFNVIYPDEFKTDTDNDNDKVDIKHSSGDLSVKPLPDLINNDVGAYAHGSNKLLETMVISESDRTNKFGNKIDELVMVSSHVFGTTGVEIPKNNFYNLHKKKEEKLFTKGWIPNFGLGSGLLVNLGDS